MRFIDICAGLGGFHLAAKRLDGKCVFACEIEEDLRMLYQRNFGQKISGDLAKILPKEIPDHDLLCAGFPCQPFSKAGDQTGWEDAKHGNVLTNVIDIVCAKRPRLILLENVAHFVRHDKGNTYRHLRETLETLGYAVDYHQYSPHRFGVPQIRERIYMVACVNSLRGFSWPKPRAQAPDLRNILEDHPVDAGALSKRVLDCLEVWQCFLDALPTETKLPSFPIWAMECGATYPTDRGSLHRLPVRELWNFRGIFGQSLRGLSRREIEALLPSHALRKRDCFPTWKRTFVRQNREFFAEHKKKLGDWFPEVRKFPPSLQKLEWNCQGEERSIWNYVLQFRASGVRVKRPSTSPSLVAMTSTQIPIIGWERRYMTARECAKLQSMSSLRHLPAGIRAFEALGNAVNVTVVTAILRRLLPLLSDEQSRTDIYADAA